MGYTSVVLCMLLSILCLHSSLATATQGTVHAISKSKYTRAHSLGENYQFDARDGWEKVDLTDMQYKYARDNISNPEPQGRSLEKRVKHKGSKGDNDGGSGLGTLKHVIGQAWNGLKAIGGPEPVIITWYTGHDLLNPSCWSNGKWHPTDSSFAAALTLEGWKSRPSCFKFLELCHTAKKCVFVRVVDTCAGCAKGSKHVDLTKAAFGQLADFGTGQLKVQMRMASEPTGWHEDLWGPKKN